MPGNLLYTDIAFPAVSGDDTKRDLKNVLNYLYMLREELRYTMGNIGVGNFNDTELTDLSNIVTKELSITVKSVEGSLSQIIGRADETETSLTLLSQYTTDNSDAIAIVQTQADANGSNISLVASYTGQNSGMSQASFVLSAINGQSYAAMNADRINFTGFTTFMRPADVGEYGTTTIDGGRITANSLSFYNLADRPTNADTLAIWENSGYKTYIDANGVYSGNLTGVNIYGANYYSLNGNSQLELLDQSGGTYGGVGLTLYRQGGMPAFKISSVLLNTELYAYGDLFFQHTSTGTNYPQGTWNFSQATVSGVTATFG